MKSKKLIIAAFFGLLGLNLSAQSYLQPTMDEMTFYTQEWKGERFPDGRPKVSDDLINRALSLSLEEIWGQLRNKGYNNQYADGWETLNEIEFSGRAVTVQYMPNRNEFAKRLQERGIAEGRTKSGGTNSWPIDLLQKGDIYVADGFGKIENGTLIGDILGNTIFAKTGKGVVFEGSARDSEGLREIEGFNSYARGYHPSYIMEMMMTAINRPIRIGPAIVFPGDVVVAKKQGIAFIPAHLVEDVVTNGEYTALRDDFGHAMVINGTYTAGQIDSGWSEEIRNHFVKWLSENPGKVKMTREQLDKFLNRGRSF